MATLKSREQLLEEEKRLKGEIEKKHGKSVEDLYEEREKRLRDAIALKEPDRVPVVLGTAYFQIRYVPGLTVADLFRDEGGAWRQALREAGKKVIVDFDPDIYSLTGAPGGNSGSALEILKPKQYKWAGAGLGPNSSNQFLETENMKADEYDIFLRDPGDFILRYYLPRVWGTMAPLSKLPPLQSLLGASNLASQSARFSSPDVIEAFETLFKAGKEQEKYRQAIQAAESSFEDEMADLGFPPLAHAGGVGGAPWDTIASNLRGTQGIMADMYHRPEKLLAACEKILEIHIARGTPADPRKRGNPKRTSPHWHRAEDKYMSAKHFETFYWPTWKKLLLKNVELGYVNLVRCEGHYYERLKYLLELPKGKVVACIFETDPAKAKEILGDQVCILGGVPHILLQTASPPEVEEYCINLIKVCGKGGGFVLGPSTELTADAKPENVKAMVDSVKKYGWS